MPRLLISHYPDSFKNMLQLAGLLTHFSLTNLPGHASGFVDGPKNPEVYSCGNSSGFSPDSLFILGINVTPGTSRLDEGMLKI